MDCIALIRGQLRDAKTGNRCHEIARNLQESLGAQDWVDSVRVVDGMVSYTYDRIFSLLCDQGKSGDFLYSLPKEKEIGRCEHSWCEVSTGNGQFFHASHYHFLELVNGAVLRDLSVVLEGPTIDGLILRPSRFPKYQLKNHEIFFHASGRSLLLGIINPRIARLTSIHR